MYSCCDIITQNTQEPAQCTVRILTLNRATVDIYVCTVLYCTVQSMTFPQIPCGRLCENVKVLRPLKVF